MSRRLVVRSYLYVLYETLGVPSDIASRHLGGLETQLAVRGLQDDLMKVIVANYDRKILSCSPLYRIYLFV